MNHILFEYDRHQGPFARRRRVFEHSRLIAPAILAGATYLSSRYRKIEIDMSHLRKRRVNVSALSGGSHTMSQSHEVSEISSILSCPSMGGFSVHKANQINGNEVINIKEKTRSRFKHAEATAKELLKTLFPTLNVNRRSYGTSYASIVGLTPLNTGIPVVRETSTGTCRTMFCNANQQSWYGFMHLLAGNEHSPAQNTVVSTYVTPSPAALLGSTYSLADLQMLAFDTTNRAYSSLFGTPQTAIAANSGGSSVANPPLKFYNSLNYKGGHTKHFFYNPGNVDIFVEYFICRPKFPLPLSKEPLTLLSEDKIIHDQKILNANATSASFQNGVSTTNDNVSLLNPLHTITRQDNLLHYHYYVEKPAHIKILPGATATVTVTHSKFHYFESPWNQPLTGTPLTSDASLKDSIVYLPATTAFLLVRFKGQMVTDDSGGTLITAVNSSACQLAHWQEEIHCVGCIFPAAVNQSLRINDVQDAVVGAAKLNDLTNNLEPAEI